MIPARLSCPGPQFTIVHVPAPHNYHVPTPRVTWLHPWAVIFHRARSCSSLPVQLSTEYPQHLDTYISSRIWLLLPTAFIQQAYYVLLAPNPQFISGSQRCNGVAPSSSSAGSSKNLVLRAMVCHADLSLVHSLLILPSKARKTTVAPQNSTI